MKRGRASLLPFLMLRLELCCPPRWVPCRRGRIACPAWRQASPLITICRIKYICRINKLITTKFVILTRRPTEGAITQHNALVVPDASIRAVNHGHGRARHRQKILYIVPDRSSFPLRKWKYDSLT